MGLFFVIDVSLSIIILGKENKPRGEKALFFPLLRMKMVKEN